MLSVTRRLRVRAGRSPIPSLADPKGEAPSEKTDNRVTALGERTE